MPKNEKNRPIIIKRGGDSGEGGHHGGAWKIAYADFMTAMMAFFLVMWLLNATTEEQRKGIAQFFNPMAEKETRPGPTNSLLETEPSPLTGGASVQRVKDGEHEEDTSQGNPGGKKLYPRNNNEPQPDSDITEGLRAHKLSAAPAIIPIGGAESGGTQNLGYVGTPRAKETAQLSQMLDDMKTAIQQNPQLSGAAGNMSVRAERDDIRIELRDAENKPMFDSASAVPNTMGRKMLIEIAAWLAPMPEKLSIVGYTDAAPYKNTKKWGMSNWTLSTMRADRAREVLVKAGYPDGKILDVKGCADRDLALPDAPSAAGNRRVVLVLHRRYPDTQPPAEAANAPAPDQTTALVPLSTEKGRDTQPSK
ncbi:MAG: chemotaxis protein MotB [Acetobacter sp.]|nr:chemotaxis protein MotB [Acetobacter sp.]